MVLWKRLLEACDSPDNSSSEDWVQPPHRTTEGGQAASETLAASETPQRGQILLLVRREETFTNSAKELNHLSCSPKKTSVDLFLKLPGDLALKMAGIFGEFSVVSVSLETKHEKSSVISTILQLVVM